MTTIEMKNRYEHLYDKMKSSKKVEYMMIFGNAEKIMFNKLALVKPELAEEWVSMLEAICWNNFLTESQAKSVVENIINQDGSTGPHWSMETFFSLITTKGFALEEEPYFNKYALWAIANIHYSDHAQSVAEDMGYKSINDVSNEKMGLSMYRKAVESLKDPDKPNFLKNWLEV